MYGVCIGRLVGDRYRELSQREVIEVVAVDLVLLGITVPGLLLVSPLVVDGGKDDDVQNEQQTAQSYSHAKCCRVAVVFAGNLLQ